MPDPTDRHTETPIEIELDNLSDPAYCSVPPASVQRLREQFGKLRQEIRRLKELLDDASEYVGNAITQLEDEVEPEFSHTSAQHGIQADLQMARELWAEIGKVLPTKEPPPRRDLQLPADVVTNRYGTESGEWVTEHNVVGPNLVVWCKCKERDDAETIAHALNQLPREPLSGLDCVPDPPRPAVRRDFA